MSDPYQSPSGPATGHRAAPTRVRYWVLAALCLAAIVAYVQRNSIGVAEAHIRKDLGLSKQQMGWILSAFFWTYAIFQLPTGYLGQTWGTRRGLTFFAVVFSLAAGLFALGGVVGLTFAFAWLIGARLLMGATQSGIFPCAVNTIQKWLPDSRRSTASGMLGSSMSIGGAVGAAITGLLLGGFWVFDLKFEAMSWEWVFALFCLPGLLFAALFYFWFRDEPHQHAKVNAAEIELIRGPTDEGDKAKKQSDEPEVAEPTPWGVILSSPAMWGLCAQQVFRAAGYIFFATWFATFLRETHHVGDAEAGIMTSLPLWATVLGSPTGGAISDWILNRTGSRRWSRQGLAACSMLAAAIFYLAGAQLDHAWLAVTVITCGSFCAAFGGPCAYTSTIDMGGRHVPMVFSMMNMAGNFGAAGFPLIVPWVLAASGGEQSGDWSVVLYVFAAMFVAAAVCWLLVNPNKSIVEQTKLEGEMNEW